jgi:opacity protein-like surface antigen
VLRFDLGALSTNTNNVNRALYDSGSYIKLFLRTADDPTDEKTGVGLTFWPLDTDRFRLGYLYDISWGGTNASINQSIFPRLQGTAPGAKLSYDNKFLNLFVGFKTAQIVQVEQTLTPGTSEVEEIRVGQTNFGVLGGAGVQIIDNLRVDVGGGYFQQGKFDLPDVMGEPVFTAGVSARIVAHHEDMPAPQSIDFLLYRNDPNKPQIIFKPAKYDLEKILWNVSLEGTHLWQNLKDFDVSGATTLQPARALALQGNLQANYFRLSLTGIYRDLPYVLRNQPSYVPFESLPSGDAAKRGDEFFVAVAGDYYIEPARLTPGIGAGLQFPATFKTDSVDLTGNTIGRTVVVRQQGNLAILPVDRNAVPIFQARVSLKWDISTILSAMIWAQYIRDNNGTFVERDPNEGTVALRTFISPDFFGFGTSVQARF